MLMHGDYASVANGQAKFSAIFCAILGITCVILKFSFIYSTIFRGTANEVLWNPGWKTRLCSVAHTDLASKKLHVSASTKWKLSSQIMCRLVTTTYLY